MLIFLRKIHIFTKTLLNYENFQKQKVLARLYRKAKGNGQEDWLRSYDGCPS